MESADSKPPRSTPPAKSRKATAAEPARKRSRSDAVTIRDVAERSGFSSATVSIVLNNAPLARYIPDTTKGRIQRAAAQLGYRPNLFARSLRGRRSHTVGVMVFDMTDPYCTLVLRGIENTLYQSSYLPILTDVHNERSRFERYLEMLLDRRIEGLVVLANWLFVDINVLADLEKNNIPTATVGRELKNDKISSVIVDNAIGARAALEHLHSLGHRKIAFIRGPRPVVRHRTALARRPRAGPRTQPRTRSAPDRRSARIGRSRSQVLNKDTN
jgi:LacI family transcriptional regulator